MFAALSLSASQPPAAGWCATMTVRPSPGKEMGGSPSRTSIQTSAHICFMLPLTLREMSWFLSVQPTGSAIRPSMTSKPGQRLAVHLLLFLLCVEVSFFFFKCIYYFLLFFSNRNPVLKTLLSVGGPDLDYRKLVTAFLLFFFFFLSHQFTNFFGEHFLHHEHETYISVLHGFGLWRLCCSGPVQVHAAAS